MLTILPGVLTILHASECPGPVTGVQAGASLAGKLSREARSTASIFNPNRDAV